jgi:CDP-diacylglycerol--glycerol-3-phosphate 3-phosphatidyltransferase
MRLWTLPNLLTLLRIALIPVLVGVFYLPWSHASLAAGLIFLVAAITDWFDGWLARRYGLHTAFGAFLDPVADKLMVAVVLVVLVQSDPKPWLAMVAAVIIGREISISALREWMAELGQRASVAVAWIGKWKTGFQMTALTMMLLREPLFGLPVYQLGQLCLIVAAVLTLWSALSYLRAAWTVLGRQDSGQG